MEKMSGNDEVDKLAKSAEKSPDCQNSSPVEQENLDQEFVAQDHASSFKPPVTLTHIQTIIESQLQNGRESLISLSPSTISHNQCAIEDRPKALLDPGNISLPIPLKTKLLLARTTCAQAAKLYEPSLTTKANFMSTHRLLKSYAYFVNQLSSVSIPSKVSDALRDPKWSKAIEAQMEALEKNHTWELVSFPHGKQTVGRVGLYS